jgi:hypothetical protein
MLSVSAVLLGGGVLGRHALHELFEPDVDQRFELRISGRTEVDNDLGRLVVQMDAHGLVPGHRVELPRVPFRDEGLVDGPEAELLLWALVREPLRCRPGRPRWSCLPPCHSEAATSRRGRPSHLSWRRRGPSPSQAQAI